jgi:hypothetical protein
MTPILAVLEPGCGWKQLMNSFSYAGHPDC